MPELPEVHTFQLYFNEASLHVPIKKVVVHDDKIIRNIDASSFSKNLKGRTFIGSMRRGKYLFGELDNGHHILLHFGMTGDLKYYADKVDAPKHERFVFQFEDGFNLGFDCPRKFARICYIEDLQDYIAAVKLGEDALTISEEIFMEQMVNKKCTIKAYLLNQKMIAGVGNLYADEILYQTRVHPASRVHALKKKQKNAIFMAMKNILEKAVSESAHYKEHPEDWFFKWRVEGQKAPNGRGEVQIEKIAGRTTYFFKGWQRLYE